MSHGLAPALISLRRWIVASALLGAAIVSPAAPPASAVAGESLLERAYTLDKVPAEKRDATMTAEAYRIAAESGDAYAHLRLGYLYETGDGVVQDYTQARLHYQAAVDAGLNEARLRLAICYLEGWGGPADRAAFTREMRTAAEAGYVPAQQIYAAMCFIGLAVPKDREAGLAWLERAAKQDDPLAQLQIGQDLERAQRGALSADLGLVRSWYQLSAEQEYLEGTRAMARTFLTGERKNRDWEMGQRWMLLATDQGDAEAPYTLAVCELLHVDAPEHDWEKARGWLKLASERGNAHATELLELEKGGRPLDQAAQYMIREPFEERYVRQMAAHIAGDRKNPTRVPQIYRVVSPVYPRSLRLQSAGGDVLVDFVVDTTGRVANPKAIKSAHPALSERAVEAVRQWRFYPGTKDGHAVNYHMQVPVRFEIGEERLDGVDGLLKYARDQAEQLGPEVLADATELRPAYVLEAMPYPTKPDGSELSKGDSAIILLVVDAKGIPIRGHILFEKPMKTGAAVLAAALQHHFRTRTLQGKPVQTNVVLAYRYGDFDDQVLRESGPLVVPQPLAGGTGK